MTHKPLHHLSRSHITSNVATVTSTKQTTMKQGARYFLVKVFHRAGSCYKHIPKSWKKPNGYTMLQYIKFTPNYY